LQAAKLERGQQVRRLANIQRRPGIPARRDIDQFLPHRQHEAGQQHQQNKEESAEGHTLWATTQRRS